VGWTDWNAFLSEKGGPNWAGNVVDAPIILDTEGGDAFYKNPMYYALSHLSMFVPPGSVRIETESKSSNLLESHMETVGFLRPDGLLALVVLNRAVEVTGDATPYTVELPSGTFLHMEIPPHSFQTLVVKV